MQNQYPQEAPPENHLVWAILTTCFCCMPLGVVSIIKSTKVKELWLLGDAAGAQKAADDAKKYAIWSAVLLPIVLVIFWVFALIIGLAGAILDA